MGLLALGVWSFRLIPVELLPEVESPRLTVTASWPGTSPEVMEARVTAPLEAAAQQVAGLREIRSVSRSTPRGFGASAEITLEFDPERPNKGRHLAFGYGIHRCLGASLTKLEVRAAFEALFERVEDVEFATPVTELTPVRDPNRRFESFPVEVTRAE